MVFWIVLVIAVIITIGTVVYNTMEEDLPAGILLGLAASLMSGVVGVIIVVIFGAIFMPNSHIVSTTHQTRNLTSLQTAQTSQIHGNRWYLSGSSGTGYTYMYQAKDETGQDYYKLGNASANNSRVYVSDSPKVEITAQRWEISNPWIIPFTLAAGVDHTYKFSVPEGSIVQDYKAN